ncbi:hypothetical protein DNTS_014011 [Danionella cerebrum]|uniref:FYVE-type domain-containing protein n=1 Tax=Danionella cerebrum TaxID=2873325 RepID=A0A553N5A2_9TELE|nr:hypothetical protein DNTS_014011 [Danionella translucida]
MVKNRERIQAVESSFGRTGKILQKAGRILVGEGHLKKHCRRGPKLKVFFLFNDILVYGSIMVPGRWNHKQKIIPLEDVLQEDMEDGMDMSNQWLIRTPCKSFYVSAASPEEKREWMRHISQSKALHAQHNGLPADNTVGNFATPWIPDIASAICMRCSKRFTVTNRRHHCRRCGYIVCKACSKSRALLPNISSRPVRVCRNCMSTEKQETNQKRMMGKYRKMKKNSVEDTRTQPEYETSSDEELGDQNSYHVSTKWFKDNGDEDLSPYCYFKPEHMNPPVRQT